MDQGIQPAQTPQIHTITVAQGDGIGPEIVLATLKILDAAHASLRYEFIDIGEKEYLAGNTSGISESAWSVLLKNRILLKGPITTPQGKGYKSLNVTMRKVLGLYANVRPCRSYAPFVKTYHPNLDLVIVRENEEDLYAGIEHRQTDEVYQCLKLISRPGTEKIIRYAFEYALANNRKKVTCMSKDNIMKMTDGLFHQVFDEVAKEYPSIQTEHMIIDIGAARIADTPEIFDVIVTSNLYGDIISDIAAQVAGSVGLAGSANIGSDFAMFEAIHGSAPDIAGRGIANPSGLLQAAIQMLVHLGQAELASTIQNAWLKTLEDRVHTADIFKSGLSQKLVSTQQFADAVIARLGSKPTQFQPACYQNKPPELNVQSVQAKTRLPAKKEIVGVDLFLHEPYRDVERLATRLLNCLGSSDLPFKLEMISNRGVKLWPGGYPNTFCTDHWRCRFLFQDPKSAQSRWIWMLAQKLQESNFDVIKSENLYLFDGVRGYSLGQGQ